MDGVPLTVLIRAAAALKLAKDAPICGGLTAKTWEEVLHSHSELNYHLERLLANQAVAITTTV
jgi:hypothetical protein